jgi:transmembrane sensor
MTSRRDQPRAIPNLHQLDAYLTGELSAQERAVLDAWVAADPRHAATLDLLRRAGSSMATPGNTDVDRAWHAVAARNASRSTSRSVSRTASRISAGRWPGVMAVCGVVALVLALGTAAWHWRGDLFPSHALVPASSYATANGQRAVITLADGSRVMLNVASRIEVPTDFSRNNRTVRLYGEALFTVSHNDNAPFTVIAGPSTTRVLGTSFVVRHYDSDTAATITVRDGKVAVQSTVVAAMQQVAVGHGGVGRVEPADTSRFSFASGVLTFTDTPLIDAIPALNRWYDVDLRLGDPSLATRKVVGGFKAGSPTDLMMMLGWTFNTRVVQDGRILTLYPKTR